MGDGTLPQTLRLPLPPRYLFAGAAWPAAARALEKRRPESCKNTFGLIHTEILAAVVGPYLKGEEIPYLVILHGENTDSRPSSTPLRRKLIREALCGAQRVVVVGRSLLPLLQRLAGDDVKGIVIENGFDPEVEELPEGVERPSSRRFRICCVGNLQIEKGQRVLLAASRLLRDAGIDHEIVLVGDGADRGTLKSLVRQFALGDRVLFRGRLSPKDSAREIAAADAFVLPSRREALGIVYLNAMALGKPTVGVRGQGIDGIIRHGETGYLVSPECPEEMAAVLQTIARDRTAATRVAASGRDLVREKFSWDANTMRLLNLIQGIC